MTERAASSTAVLVCQGRAAADGRFAVGRLRDAVVRELHLPAGDDRSMRDGRVAVAVRT